VNTSNTKYDVGVIHGRFQVLHNDHLKYLLSGQKLCRHLVVGITNPEPMLVREEKADPNRSSPLANPLTYYERYHMVKAVLLNEGLSPDAFSVVPLPINLPDRYHNYVPMDAVFFLSIYDQWGQRKLDYFRSLGLKTHILRKVPSEEKGVSASHVRQRMLAGEAWEHLVPAPAAQWLHTLDLPSRLKKMKAEER
jgi:nicotinamide-nucleotide adenylyltransferase